MWSSTGNFPPTGLFDGQLTDLGSYRGCVDLVIPPPEATSGRATNGTQPKAGHANYCMLGFRPVVPSRKAFHMIYERESDDLIRMFNRSDAFTTLLEKAQFFHYVYLQWGLCVPHQCSAVDIQRVASALAHRLALMAGPVKCYTKARSESPEERGYQFGEIDNKPILVDLGKPMNRKQLISTLVVGSFFGLVFAATFWHFVERRLIGLKAIGTQYDDFGIEEEKQVVPEIKYTGLQNIAFNYLSMITNGKEFMDASMRSNEIKCLHGLRVITMIWIILVHTLQYNNWAGFTRIFESETILRSLALHPIYNANYTVDNFFFMSGLLAAYTTWHAQKRASFNYSVWRSLLGRYLRLTPQVLLISLLYIILPLAGNSPFWHDMSDEPSRLCEKNWWVNLLHVQAFYREDEMCNLVGWWISVDMFYYVIALGLIYMVLNNKRYFASISTLLLLTTCMSVSAYKHYVGGYTPNNLGSVPQIGEVWTRYVINFFWSPFPHAYPFFLGFWTGYMIAKDSWRRLVQKWSSFGWCLALVSMILVSMSSHIWMSGMVKLGNQYISTAYNTICVLLWATSYAWIVIACHYGCAPTLNKILSVKLFVYLSKASFIIYLSHMLLVRIYFGLQNTLIEPSLINLNYIVIGNAFVAGLFGVFLCIAFEGPCMKFQKWVLQSIASSSKTSPKHNVDLARETNSTDQKVILGMSPSGNALLKY